MSCLCVAVLPKVAHHDYDGRHCMCTAVDELENLAPAPRPPSHPVANTAVSRMLLHVWGGVLHVFEACGH